MLFLIMSKTKTTLGTNKYFTPYWHFFSKEKTGLRARFESKEHFFCWKLISVERNLVSRNKRLGNEIWYLNLCVITFSF